ncbi:MAG: hypothetical protein GC165_19740 [Armatimonadetes bacterium]|nr:hypothetical protein [Armatimonadota bacterium]
MSRTGTIVRSIVVATLTATVHWHQAIAVLLGILCGSIDAYYSWGKPSGWSAKQLIAEPKRLPRTILSILWSTSVCDILLFFSIRAQSLFTFLLACMAGFIAQQAIQDFPGFTKKPSVVPAGGGHFHTRA